MLEDIVKLRRFCYVGSFEPVYTHKNFRVDECWKPMAEILKKMSAESLVALLSEVFRQTKLVRRDEATFLLAAFFAAKEEQQDKCMVRCVVNEFIKTDLELFLFCRYAKMVALVQKRSYFSKTVRKCIVAWYEQKTPQEIANLWMERRGAHGLTHKTLMILCHINDGSIGSKGLSTSFFSTCTQLINDNYEKATNVIVEARKVGPPAGPADGQQLLLAPFERLSAQEASSDEQEAPSAQLEDQHDEQATPNVEQAEAMEVDEELTVEPQPGPAPKKSTGAVPKRVDAGVTKGKKGAVLMKKLKDAMPKGVKPQILAAAAARKSKGAASERLKRAVPKKEEATEEGQSTAEEKPQTSTAAGAPEEKQAAPKLTKSQKKKQKAAAKLKLAEVQKMDVDVEPEAVAQEEVKEEPQELAQQEVQQSEQLAAKVEEQQAELQPPPEALQQPDTPAAAQGAPKEKKKRVKPPPMQKVGDPELMGIEPPSQILAMSQLRTTSNVTDSLALIIKYDLAFKLIPRNLLRSATIMKEIIPRASYLELLKCWKIMARRSFFQLDNIRLPYMERLEDKAILSQANIHPIVLLMYMHRLGMNGDLSAKITCARDDKLNKVGYRSIYTESFSVKSTLPPRRMFITINLQDSYKRKMLKNHRKLSLFQATVALAFGYFKRESHVDVYYWSETPGILKPINWTRHMNIYEATSCCNGVKLGKSTQFLKAPLQHALAGTENYDLFLSIVPTAGRSNKGQKSTELCSFLDQYRERNKKARYVILDLLKFKGSMTYSQNRVENILEICGLDEHTTNLIDLFADGRFD